MTAVTSPAPRSSLPPRITHSGTTGTSSAKPANHSIAEPSSQPMPGTRQTEPDAGPPSTPIRPLLADPPPRPVFHAPSLAPATRQTTDHTPHHAPFELHGCPIHVARATW